MAHRFSFGKFVATLRSSRNALATPNVFSQKLQIRTLASQAEGPIKRTALYAVHVDLGGKMVPFAGYELPVQYKDGVVTNHLHVRQSAGLFDVSHMGQIRLHGSARQSFLEKLTVADVGALENHQSTLSVLVNEKGGIIDDCIITRRPDHIRMVINAGCKDKDIAHIKQQIAESKADVQLEIIPRSLIALQGPKAAEVLSRHISKTVDVQKWPFMFDRDLQLAGFDVSVCRCGYTGEDGFEISVADQDAPALFHKLLESKEVLPAGLGVRDSLRLEAGLCLYGHDLDETITPIEASLAWTISKRRRAEGGFMGFDVISKQLQNGVSRKRVGFNITGAPAREGAELSDMSGNKVGTITSGTFSPVLKRAVSMGYVDPAHSKIGTKLQVTVREKKFGAEVTKMPFVPNRYHRVQ